MRILITGGAGFIGSHLAAHFAVPSRNAGLENFPIRMVINAMRVEG